MNHLGIFLLRLPEDYRTEISHVRDISPLLHFQRPSSLLIYDFDGDGFSCGGYLFKECRAEMKDNGIFFIPT